MDITYKNQKLLGPGRIRPVLVVVKRLYNQRTNGNTIIPRFSHSNYWTTDRSILWSSFQNPLRGFHLNRADRPVSCQTGWM